MHKAFDLLEWKSVSQEIQINLNNNFQGFWSTE